MKILIAIINNKNELALPFVKSLFELESHTRKKHDVDMRFFNAHEVNIMRNIACKHAIENNYDYIFQMDSDMTYPKESIIELLKMRKPVTTGHYRARFPPFLPIHYKKIGKNILDQQNRTFTQEIEQIEATGGGGVLIDVNILKKLKFPYYETKYKGHNIKSEDIVFSEKLKKKKIPIFLNTKIDYGHLANFQVNQKGIIPQ